MSSCACCMGEASSRKEYSNSISIYLKKFYEDKNIEICSTCIVSYSSTFNGLRDKLRIKYKNTIMDYSVELPKVYIYNNDHITTMAVSLEDYAYLIDNKYGVLTYEHDYIDDKKRMSDFLSENNIKKIDFKVDDDIRWEKNTYDYVCTKAEQETMEIFYRSFAVDDVFDIVLTKKLKKKIKDAGHEKLDLVKLSSMVENRLIQISALKYEELVNDEYTKLKKIMEIINN